MKTKILILVLFIPLSCFSQNNTILFEQANWQEILKKAQQENKLIFLDAYAEWCAPCKIMEKQVFTSDSIVNFYNTHFVNVRMDMEKNESQALKKLYKIKVYPTLLILSAEGEVIQRKEGGMTVSGFMTFGQKIFNPDYQPSQSLRIKSFHQSYQTHELSEDSLSTYLALLSDERKYKMIAEIADEYLDKQEVESIKTAKNWKFLTAFLWNAENKSFQYVLNNLDDFITLYTKDSVYLIMRYIYERNVRKAVWSNEVKEVEKANTLLQQFAERADKEQVSVSKMLNLAQTIQYQIYPNLSELYEKNKMWDKYAQVEMQYLERTYWDEDRVLNNVAYIFYENILDNRYLENALKWSIRAIGLNNIAEYNLTYALLLSKLNKKKEARQAAKKALLLAKKERQDLNKYQKVVEGLK